MRKIAIYLPILLAFVLLFSSCEKDEVATPKTLNGTEWEAKLGKDHWEKIDFTLPEGAEEYEVIFNWKFEEDIVKINMHTKTKVKVNDLIKVIEKDEPTSIAKYIYDSSNGNVEICIDDDCKSKIEGYVKGNKMTFEVERNGKVIKTELIKK